MCGKTSGTGGSGIVIIRYKFNKIMSEIKVNKISPRTNCGTVTLGDSGDTFTIPAGATITNNGTQTGFGRTGLLIGRQQLRHQILQHQLVKVIL